MQYTEIFTVEKKRKKKEKERKKRNNLKFLTVVLAFLLMTQIDAVKVYCMPFSPSLNFDVMDIPVLR